MDINEAKRALQYADWNHLLEAADDAVFPVIIDGKPALATKAHSVDKEDADYDRDLEVIVRIGEQYFRKHGWSQIGSHCYGDYEPSWESDLTEVFPTTKTVVIWE